jgi:hypothetical protein
MVGINRFKLSGRLEDSQGFDIFALIVIGEAKLIVCIHKIGTETNRFFQVDNCSLKLINLAIQRT